MGLNFTEKLTGLPRWPQPERFLLRREYIDGPRYVESVRGAREMRSRHPGRWRLEPFAQPRELLRGIPPDWITR